VDGRTRLRATDDLILCGGLNLLTDCEILGSISGDVWDYMLKSDDMSLGRWSQMFRKIFSPQSSRLKSNNATICPTHQYTK
jgi:hypothetical protein